MALARTLSATVEGIGAQLVTVEANVGPGLPGMYIVGLGDAAVKESRERIRISLANSALSWPKTKIMVSLSPAHVPKAGSHFDLAIALSVLGSQHPQVQAKLARCFIVGELALDGQLRRVDHVLPMLIAALHPTDGTPRVVEHVIVPRANADQAALVNDGTILVADSILDVWRWLHGTQHLEPAQRNTTPSQGAPNELDFADIAGQQQEKRILEIAAAGGHHVLMIGPPGSGKSMLAERIPTIMPPMSLEEQITSTALHAAAGLLHTHVVRYRPFIAPHPSITRAALIGGGSGHPRPGAISQAHNGVLFLDEVSEIPANILDLLRIPLEKRQVKIIRPKREITFPADTQLILATNPCPCGQEENRCTCKASVRLQHLRNLSGPLRDRLDITMHTTREAATLHATDAEPSAAIAQRVLKARQRAAARWADYNNNQPGVLTNARIPGPVLRRDFPAELSAMYYLESKLARGDISQRGVDSVLRLAWTLADLAEQPQPDLSHIDEALHLRKPQP